MRVSRALARVLTLEPTPCKPFMGKASVSARRAQARLRRRDTPALPVAQS